MEIKLNNIPPELRQLKQWICHRNKVPIGKVNDPKTWLDITTAQKDAIEGEYDGLGFVFSKDGQYCGVDLDHCRNAESGVIKPWAAEIIKELDSYTEVSWSGTGIHIIVKAKLLGTGRKAKIPGTENKVEIYDRGHFFVMTGARLKRSTEVINERQAEVLELYNLLKPEATHTGQKTTTNVKQVSPVLSDEDVIKKASEAGNGAKFKQLMDGDSSDYPSPSEADGALAALVGFYTQDFDQILRIIERSALWRDKWEREDYQQSTIYGALAKLTDFWKPKRTVSKVDTTKAEPEPVAEKVPPPNVFDMKILSPPPGFLREYMAFQEPLSEAPAHLHVFTGLILLSSAIGKKVYFPIGLERKYTNLWIVINGPSGCKKSTAINNAGKMFIAAGLKDNRLPTQFTSEILIEMLSKNPVGVFFWSEWGSTMDSWSKSYASDIMSILTDLYDSGYFSRWLRSEKFEIDGACINMICGCTPEWLKTVLDAKRAAMGYWPRFLFVPAGEPEKYLPIPPTPDPERTEEIAGQLKAISESIPDEHPQEAHFPKKVEGLYSGWYITKKSEASKGDSLSQSFTTRLLDYAKKIAILVELSQVEKREGITAIEVSVESMEYAIKLCEWLEKTARYTILQATRSTMSELEEKIAEFIQSKGEEGTLRRDISQRFHREVNREVTWALDNLENAEIIYSESITPKSGRPGKKYFYNS